MHKLRVIDDLYERRMRNGSDPYRMKLVDVLHPPVYLKDDVDKLISEKDAFIKTLGEGQADLAREIERLKGELAALREEHRWRKASGELPPDGTEVPVILSNGWRTTDYFEEDKNRWHYHWDTVVYWFPTPKTPEE